MMSNKTRSVLYIGVTNGLLKRVAQHLAGEVPGFTQQYHCTHLVYFEQYRNVRDAIAREKQLRLEPRKEERVDCKMNPYWKDLAADMLEEVG